MKNKRNIKYIVICILTVAILVFVYHMLFTASNSQKSCEIGNDTLPICEVDTPIESIPVPIAGVSFEREMNTIDAHNEQDTIVGNFTGHSIDTLFVRSVFDENTDIDNPPTYYMTSTNKNIPEVEIYGCLDIAPKLVNEGDLDGNGTCEVGYLHTWINSQWRYYRIFTLVKGKWVYLVDGDYLDTPEWFRHSGVEVAEKGKKKGTILIHHYSEEYNMETDERILEILDTIVKPTFTEIND